MVEEIRSDLPTRLREILRQVMPTRALALLMLIGVADLISTAWLHSRGLIVEANPILRPVIDRSELLFALVKGSTLVAAYLVMLEYAKTNRAFVRKASCVACVVYMAIWSGGVISGFANPPSAPDAPVAANTPAP